MRDMPTTPTTIQAQANRGAQLLRAWRDAQGSSQGALGDATGIHEQTISKYERGVSLPSRTHATALWEHCAIPTAAWDQPPDEEPAS